MEWPKPSSARSSVTMSASVRVRMQRPSCTSYQLGSITTTRFTRTRHSDIVHPVSSSQLTEARDRVRSFGGYNTLALSSFLNNSQNSIFFGFSKIYVSIVVRDVDDDQPPSSLDSAYPKGAIMGQASIYDGTNRPGLPASKARGSPQPGPAVMRAGNHLAVLCLFFGAAFAAFVSGSLEQRLEIYFPLV